MAFTLVATSSGLSAIAADGTTTSLTLPGGVSAVNAVLRGAVLNRFALLANAFSQPVWVDEEMTVYPVQLAGPSVAPTLATGAGTGYTGTRRSKVQFLIKSAAGAILGASELSPASNAVTCANQNITYTVLATSPNAAVNCRRIYSTATNGTSYFWDFDLDDNTTTTVTKATTDASLATDAVDPLDYVAAPSGIVNVVGHKGRAWAVSSIDPDTIYGSQLDDVTSWPVSIPTYPLGAEKSGVTGFGPRRDDLVFFKRASIQKIVGDSPDNFRITQIAQGQGCVAPDSVIVTRDYTRWLDTDGVWELGPDDIPRSLSDEKVRPWFTSDTYFNRSMFPFAFGAYDPRKHSYDLFLCATGTTTINRVVSYDILSGRWFGPHVIATFTPAGRCLASDTTGTPRLLLGGTNGIVYATTAGNYTDGTSDAIDFDCYTKFHTGGNPDLTHLFLQPTVLTKKESGGTLTVTPYVGALDASAGTAQSHDLTKERERLARFGVGRLCQIRFRQNTAAQGVELYGYELPYLTLGRR